MLQRSRPFYLYLDALALSFPGIAILVGLAAFFGPLAAAAELLYPAAALFAAVLLLWRKPVLYVGFMWWVWFLTPEIRRLVDYRTGFNEASIVMLTPFLVTGIALVAVLFKLGSLPRAYRTPLAFVSFSLLYAYVIGVMNSGLVTPTFDLLNWGTPIIIGVYLLTYNEYADGFRRVTRQTFMWGLLVMGVYGIIQFFYLPPWDGFWMDNAAIVSIGYSEPQRLRVFSTLNSAAPFATVVMAGLLLAFDKGSVARIPGTVAGFVAFALSAVRSAWGGWVVGLVVVAASLPLRARLRLLGTLVLLTVVVVPVLAAGPIGELLARRLGTFTNLGDDTSFNERLAFYADITELTAGNPLGQGLGSTGVASAINNRNAALQNLDSGIIAVVYVFGVLGTLYYVGGAAALFGMVLRTGLRSRNMTEAVYVGITVGTLSQLPLGNMWAGVPGMVLWFFPCLYLASRAGAATQPDQALTLQPSGRGSITHERA